MSKNSDNLLGMGGQRATVSRSAIRGGQGGTKGGPSDDARERKQDLLRKLREKHSAEETKDTEGQA